MEIKNKDVSAPFNAELNDIVPPMGAEPRADSCDSPIYVRKTSLEDGRWRIEFKNRPAGGFSHLDSLYISISDQRLATRSQSDREDICFVVAEHNETIRLKVLELRSKGRRSFTGNLIAMTRKRFKDQAKSALLKLMQAGVNAEDVVSMISTQDADTLRALWNEQGQGTKEFTTVC